MKQNQTIGCRAACPHCWALDQEPGTRCQGCDRWIVQLPEWTQPATGRKGLFGRHGWIFMTRWKWILLVLFLALGGAFVWENYPVVPNPVTLIFKRATTNLSSNSALGQWAMHGANLQRTRYLPNVTVLPQGRLLWSTEPGALQGSSVPAITDGTLYVGSTFKFMAFDAATGNLLWEKPTPGLVTSSPAVAGNMVYMGSTDGHMHALDRFTGVTRWSFKTGSPIHNSPSVSNGLLFFGSTDRYAYAVDAATGKFIWKYRTNDSVMSPPSLSKGILYFTSADKSLYSVNYRTGQSRMRFRTQSLSINEPPVVANGLVYITSNGGILTIKADIREIPARRQIEQTWTILWSTGLPMPRPWVQYGTSWRFMPESSDGKVLSAPAVTAEALYVGDTAGTLYSRDARLGIPRWRFQADGGVRVSPLVAAETVYFGTDAGTLYALDRHNGQEQWQLYLGSPISHPPVFAQGILYLRTQDGRLHAIE